MGINQEAERIIILYSRGFGAQFAALEHPTTDLTIQKFNVKKNLAGPSDPPPPDVPDSDANTPLVLAWSALM